MMEGQFIKLVFIGGVVLSLALSLVGDNSVSGNSDGANSTNTTNTTTATNETEWVDWPRITCHWLYDTQKQQTYAFTNSICKDENSPQRQELAILSNGMLVDPKGCILWRFRGLYYTKNNTWEYGINQGVRKTLNTIFKGLYNRMFSKRDQYKRMDFVEAILKLSQSCNDTLYDLANVKKVPSKEWGSFYDCVDKAWTCRKRGELKIEWTKPNRQF